MVSISYLRINALLAGILKVDSKEAEANPIVTMIREHCGQAVKCVTGFDAKGAGREQPASYIIPQRNPKYAKNRSRKASVFSFAFWDRS
jgi:hypothetical protein